MKIINRSSILEEISKLLDVSPSMYQLAIDRYTTVAEYLQGKGINASFYPQGSFRLGTVTRPIKAGIECDYDFDFVCQVLMPKNSTSPGILKNNVGDALKENTRYRDILDDEGRRCWTLNYAEKDGIGFHLDILPAAGENTEDILNLLGMHRVPSEYAKSLIAITERKNGLYSWKSSNPAGYAEWFTTINQPFYRLVEQSARQQIFENNSHIFASISAVPSQLIRTPLQRVIQILKRHRDIRFSGHELECDKPISMIITTLAATIVKNEGCVTLDIFKLLEFVVTKLSEYAWLIDNPYGPTKQFTTPLIKRDLSQNKWYIPNPVNPAENFADRWHENNNQKAKAFFDWIKWVSADLVNNLNKQDIDIDLIKSTFGGKLVERAQENYQLKHPTFEDTIKKPNVVNIVTPTKPWGVSFEQ